MKIPKMHPGTICATLISAGIVLGLIAFSARTAMADTLPAAVRLVLSEAGRLIDRKEYVKAVDVLKAFQAKGGSSQVNPQEESVHHHPMIFFALGNCRLLLGQYDQAEKEYNEVVRRRPEMTSARLNLAKACYEQGRHVCAGHHFAEAYDRAADKNPEHLYYSAAAYLAAQDHARAVQIFERLYAAHLGQAKPEWKVHFVYSLVGDGKARRALPLIRELIAAATGEERLRWQEVLLYQYIQLQMPLEAHRYAVALTREAPQTAHWWKLLGQIRLGAGDYAEALAALTIYGYLRQLTIEEQKLWADLNLQLGIPSQAASAYAALLADDPSPQTVKSLVHAYRRLGRHEEALAQLARFQTPGDDTDLLMLKADLLYEMKRFDEAARVYRQTASIDESPNAGLAWLMAGYAAWQNNELELSRKDFKRAADYKQQRTPATAAIRQLEKMN